jgi:hypothetical protein
MLPKSFFAPKLVPVLLPLRSPQQSYIYEAPVDREKSLVAGNLTGCENIHTSPVSFDRVRQSIVRCCNDCNKVGGHLFVKMLESIENNNSTFRQIPG